MHALTPENEALARQVFELALARRRSEPPLHAPRPPQQLQPALARAITPQGLGGAAVLDLFSHHIVPSCVSNDHPGFLAFVPHAPTEAAIYADWLLSAFPAFTGAWDDGAGIVAAENAVLGWLAGLAALPAGAGGSFVPGATIGTLSALHAARAAAALRGVAQPARRAILAGSQAHASVAAAARVLDVDLIEVPAGAGHVLHGAAVHEALQAHGRRVFAVVATAGTTSLGMVDDLPGIAAACRATGTWLHVDAAYGGAALVSSRARSRLEGIAAADSLVVDPHKWLFAPYDSCALLFREPQGAAPAFALHADYLDPAYLDPHAGDGAAMHPYHLGLQLSRRGRGLPLWWSLATYGTRAYEAAIDAALDLTQQVAHRVRADPALELVAPPVLSVVALRRRGWDATAHYQRWCDQLLREGVARLAPALLDGRPMLRLCLLNPRADLARIDVLLQRLRDAGAGGPIDKEPA